MLLTPEQEQMFLENMPLVYYFAKKLVIFWNDSDYEDIVSEGNFGLLKAILSFDESKNIKFSTYASRCIKNEIFMYFRKEKKHLSNISLDEPIATDDEGNKLTLADKVPKSTNDFTEQIAKQIEEDKMFIEIINIILNLLGPRYRSIILWEIAGMEQKDMALALNISPTYVSKLKRRAKHKIRLYFMNKQQFKEVFSMAKVGDSYQISFSSKDIKQFNKIFATLLNNLTSTEGLPDFSVMCNNERIIVRVPAQLESFSFIAQIINEIDNYSMTYINPIKGENLQEVKKDDAKFNEIESDDSEETSKNSKLSASTTTKRGSATKKIRNYILSQESFTFKELKEKFPEVKATTIGYVLHSAKNEGLISNIGRGKYVTKN